MTLSQKGLIAFLLSVAFLFGGVLFDYGERFFIPMWLFGCIGGMGFASISKKS